MSSERSAFSGHGRVPSVSAKVLASNTNKEALESIFSTNSSPGAPRRPVPSDQTTAVLTPASTDSKMAPRLSSLQPPLTTAAKPAVVVAGSSSVVSPTPPSPSKLPSAAPNASASPQPPRLNSSSPQPPRRKDPLMDDMRKKKRKEERAKRREKVWYQRRGNAV